MNAVTLALNDPGAAAANMFGAAPSIADVEVSDDGQNFRKLVDIPNDGGVEHTIYSLRLPHGSFGWPSRTNRLQVSEI